MKWIILYQFLFLTQFSKSLVEFMQPEKELKNITAQILEQLVKDFKYVIVNFHKSNCKICERDSDVLFEFARKINKDTNQVWVVRLNIENTPEILKKYQIDHFSSIVIFRKQEPITYKGKRTVQELLKFFKSIKSLKIIPITSKQEFSSLEKSKLSALLIMKKRNHEQINAFYAFAANRQNQQFYYTFSKFARGEINYQTEYNFVVFKNSGKDDRILSLNQIITTHQMNSFYNQVNFKNVIEMSEDLYSRISKEQRNTICLLTNDKNHIDFFVEKSEKFKQTNEIRPH